MNPNSQGPDTPRIVRMFALATSVIFELMAGPFMGYFSGMFLVERVGLPSWAMPVAVALGFILSFYAAFLTINKINDITPHG